MSKLAVLLHIRYEVASVLLLSECDFWNVSHTIVSNSRPCIKILLKCDFDPNLGLKKA